jgi:outer membrane protein TolC
MMIQLSGFAMKHTLDRTRTRFQALPGSLLATLICFFAVTPGTFAQTVGSSPAAKPDVPVITLDEAIRRAQANEPVYAAAAGDSKSAHLDKRIAQAALLPTVTYHNQFLYTQPNGTIRNPSELPKFIANNAVHEYTSQASVDQTIGLSSIADAQRANFAELEAKARLEIARRGLVATVVSAYFTLQANHAKLATAQRASEEASRFVRLAQTLESGREVAHADVVKATLQEQQRQREFDDARLDDERARLDLGVLLFPDPRTDYRLQETTQAAPPSSYAEVEAAAQQHNPDLARALAALHSSEKEVLVARGAYLPDLSLNYTYGIDAAQFAANTPEGLRNLGYSASVTLDIPVWDWLATHNRVKQSEIRRDVAKVELNATQRQLIANLQQFYSEVTVAYNQLTSLTRSVDTARESLRLTNLRYTGGEATALEVVDAQNAFTAAEQAYADGVVRYRLALANLQTLTGVL